MTISRFSRRALLLSAAAAACGHRKATGFRGLCFVANQSSRAVAVVDPFEAHDETVLLRARRRDDARRPHRRVDPAHR